jgi:hypothetical protein
MGCGLHHPMYLILVLPRLGAPCGALGARGTARVVKYCALARMTLRAARPPPSSQQDTVQAQTHALQPSYIWQRASGLHACLMTVSTCSETLCFESRSLAGQRSLPSSLHLMRLSTVSAWMLRSCLAAFPPGVDIAAAPVPPVAMAFPLLASGSWAARAAAAPPPPPPPPAEPVAT